MGFGNWENGHNIRYTCHKVLVTISNKDCIKQIAGLSLSLPCTSGVSAAVKKMPSSSRGRASRRSQQRSLRRLVKEGRICHVLSPHEKFAFIPDLVFYLFYDWFSKIHKKRLFQSSTDANLSIRKGLRNFALATKVSEWYSNIAKKNAQLFFAMNHAC